MLIELSQVAAWLETLPQHTQDPVAPKYAAMDTYTSTLGDQMLTSNEANAFEAGWDAAYGNPDEYPPEQLAHYAITAIMRMLTLTHDVSKVGGLLVDTTQGQVRAMVHAKVKAHREAMRAPGDKWTNLRQSFTLPGS